MRQRLVSFAAIVLTGGFALLSLSPAHALTMQECSAKYKAAQAAGTLKGMKWNEFRKAECSSTAEPTAAIPEAAEPSASTPPITQPKSPAMDASVPTATPLPAAAGDVVFPTEVSAKYASESPGKARMHTCLDQYNANKATNGNGGLKWIQKGGGYYSECSKRLK
jgi:hypothetical protein